MKLVQAQANSVVRNTRNGSHYQVERPERGKVRIWPLELFPNGLLINKPAPTLVEPDLEVVLVGPWVEGMRVEGKPSQPREVYEDELVGLERRVVELRLAYEALPRSGTGKLSRGSFANKVKNVERRIGVLKRGLGFVEGAATVVQEAPATLAVAVGMVCQVPSGRPAKLLDFREVGNTTYAKIQVGSASGPIRPLVPCEVLRPFDEARLCTV